MLYISYQGIYDGQNYEFANTPNQIGKAFNAGYSCMVDVWRLDSKLYVGTLDAPIEVTEKYLQGNRFWISAMNDDMYNWLLTQPINKYPNYFESPEPYAPYVTTSSGHDLVYSNTPSNNNCIIVLPEIVDRGLLSTVKLRNYGLCSAFGTFIKRYRNEGSPFYGDINVPN